MRRECYVCGKYTPDITHAVCVNCKADSIGVSQELDVYGGNNDSNQPKIGELLPGCMVSEEAP